MAKFTVAGPLSIRWVPGIEIQGSGATSRIPDALVEEFIRDIEPNIPGGVTWITQDETSAIPSFPIAQANVSGLVSDLAALVTADGLKYDKAGGTISGAATVTGAFVAQSTLSAVGLATLGSVIANAVTATTARFKGGPWHDVRAYGATGDGATNDAAAIQAAIAAAVAAGGATVFIPPGTYKLGTTTLWITSNGTSSGTQANICIVGAGLKATDLTYTGSGTAISSGTSSSPGNTTIVLEGFTLTGDGSTGTARGIHLKRYYNSSSIRNVLVRGFAGTGIHLHRCFSLNIDTSYVSNCGGYGIRWDTNNAGGISNTRIKGCTLGGIWSGYSDSVTGDFDEIGDAAVGGSILNVNLQDNLGPGITFDRAKSTLVAGCFIEGNTASSGSGQVQISGTSTTSSLGIALLGNHIGANGVAAIGIYLDFCSDVYMAGNVTQSHNTAIRATSNAAYVLGAHRFSDSVGLIDTSSKTGVFIEGRSFPFTFMFSRIDVAANLTNSPIGFTGDSQFTRLTMTGDWEVRQIAARISVAPTSGTITVFPSKAGTSLQSDLSATFSVGGNTQQQTFGRAKGDITESVGAMVSSSSDLSPTTLDIIVTLTGTVHLE